DIAPEPIEWLWPGRFAVGKLGIIAGFPDAGKSQITCNIVATVTTGGAWPGTKERADKGAAIILSAEDDAADTVRPRLEAAGADLNQVIVANSIIRTEDSARVLNVSDDLQQLTQVIETQRAYSRNVKLLIVDPISAYMGGKAKGDTFKNSEV